jgi:flagellar protein FliJ
MRNVKRSERLKMIGDLHGREEREALQALGHGQNKLSELQTQLENLQKYRQENKHRIAGSHEQAFNINQYLEYRAFAAKLDQAIAGQQSAVNFQQQDLLRVRKQWESASQRKKNMQKLLDIAISDELKIQNRREQQEQDAWAIRTAVKNGMKSA